MFTLAISYFTTRLTLLHGPHIPGSYVVLFFTVSDFTSITSHIHNWVLFLLWLHLFILSGVISLLFSSSTLGPYQPGRSSFSVVSFLLSIVSPGDQWRNNSRRNEEVEPKQKQHSVVDMTGDGSKVQCCKEQYCIGSWNITSMNQGTLEVVKQEMARVNIDILGSSELKWTGMGEFNLDDNYIYYCGQKSLGRNGVAIVVNKRVQNAVLGCNLKNNRMISVRFQCKPFNITVIQVYEPTSNAEEAEVE